MSRITPLQVEAFRKLSPEEKNAILEYYPDIYEDLNKLHKSSFDYIKFQQFKRNTLMMCRKENLDKLTKEQLIHCLRRILPFLHLVNNTCCGMQYKQFLSLFLYTIIDGLFTFRVGDIKSKVSGYLDIGRMNEDSPYKRPFPPYDKQNVVSYVKKNKYSEYFSNDLYITYDIFKKMVDVLYPKFKITNPNYLETSLKPLCKFATGKQIQILSFQKLYGFLSTIGNKISKEVDSHKDVYTEEEYIMYKTNFKFSSSQINKFLNLIPREIYLKVLKRI